jgi:RNA polymerase-associated protein CTR9
MFAANGIGILYAEKGKWDVAKELFTQVRKQNKDSIPFISSLNYL